MGTKYSGRFDDHPYMIALCMKCRKKDCFGRCADWVAVYKRLEKEEAGNGFSGVSAVGAADAE